MLGSQVPKFGGLIFHSSIGGHVLLVSLTMAPPTIFSAVFTGAVEALRRYEFLLLLPFLVLPG